MFDFDTSSFEHGMFAVLFLVFGAFITRKTLVFSSYMAGLIAAGIHFAILFQYSSEFNIVRDLIMSLIVYVMILFGNLYTIIVGFVLALLLASIHDIVYGIVYILLMMTGYGYTEFFRAYARERIGTVSDM